MYSTLWTDAPGAAPPADEPFADELTRFIRDGFVIIPGGVSHEAIDEYREDLASSIGLRTGLRLQPPRAPAVDLEDGDMFEPGAKTLDTYRFVSSTHEVIFAPTIQGFLRAVFRDDILAFQGLHFEVGSTQATHQDTAYVVVEDRPSNLVATWVALEDIQEGSGELVYYPGSHRWEPYLYGNVRHYNPEFATDAQHRRHLEWLHEEAAARGIKQASFRPRKGDVLFWHADLAHGGGVINTPGVTRRSLVTHYCPLSDRPHYFQYSHFEVTPVGSNGTVSFWYDGDKRQAPVQDAA